jgi:hypothetical protein
MKKMVPVPVMRLSGGRSRPRPWSKRRPHSFARPFVQIFESEPCRRLFEQTLFSSCQRNSDEVGNVVSVGAYGCGSLGELVLGLEIGDSLAVTNSRSAQGRDKF